MRSKVFRIISDGISSLEGHMSYFKPFGSAVAVLCLLAISGQSNAQSYASGFNETEGGKIVNLQGLEWLKLDQTYGVSRSSIESGYGGLLADGWRYASRQETSILLSSLWGGTHSGGSVDNGDGADWFFGSLGGGPLWSGTSELRNFFYGSDGECSSDPSFSCHGFYGVAYSNVGYPPTGWFYTDYGVDATSLTPSVVDESLQDSTYGSLLVRSEVAPIPEPETYAMLMAGLGILGAVARRRKQQAA